MKAPLTWLKDYVKIDVDAATLAEKLLHAGFEVEEIVYLGEGIEHVVVGKILSTAKHANADKLTVCQVAVEESGRTVQIVTGADNIKPGDWVPVALDGARLPGGKEIRSGELRGEASLGMLCSGGELGLTEADYPGAAAHGILILNARGMKIGQDIRPVVGLDEYVLDIGVTANRPDCQSILGIAREVGAVLGKPVKMPATDYTADKKDCIERYARVEVTAPDLCPRYLARVVKDVRLSPSPKFIRDRLRWAGLRPINNIVDITNFVLLELGQPMHAFDLSLVEGGEIHVRRAKSGERIVTLDGKECCLDPDVLVIADASKPVALAGIMGGENSGINDNTRAILFESAKFNRQSIRRNSRRLGVRSDSSAMYERGVYACNTVLASERSLHLIDKYRCGTIVSGGYDVNAEKKFNKVLKVDPARIDDVLGISIPRGQMVKLLNRLSIETTMINGTLHCSIPPYREDIDSYPDIAEELIRLYGYENIQGTMLADARVMPGEESAAQRNTLKLEQTLTGAGYSEIVTYSFVGPKAYDMLNLPADSPCRNSIPLLNPLGEEISLMRTTLVYSVLSNVAGNVNRKNLSGRVYELARTYRAAELPLTDLPDERNCLSLAAWGEGEDFFSMKGAVEAVLTVFHKPLDVARASENWLHPGRGADVFVEGRRVGCFGEVHPDVADHFGLEKRVYIAELDLTALLNEEPEMRYRDIPKFQDTYRDVAVTVEKGVAYAQLERAIQEHATELCEGVELFDVYEGSQIAAGKVSLAFKVRFRAPDRTLTDAEIEPIMADIFAALAACGGEIRK